MLKRYSYRLIRPLLLIGLLSGCNHAGIYGTVTNHEGEALPGVSIRLANNGEVNAVTNTLGEYRLNAKPGQLTIEYAKSGYTLVKNTLSLEQSSSSLLPVVEMWNLPSENSVFLYQKTLYTPATWLKPKRYYMTDDTSSYGTIREPDLQTTNPLPLIVCFKMPRYDARLTRLHQRKAQVPQDEKQTFDVWVPAASISVNLEPLVPSDPSLLKLNLFEELEPARYALHWGALDGYTTIDDRMYMFEILEKPDPLLGGVDPKLDGQDQGDLHIEGDAP